MLPLRYLVLFFALILPLSKSALALETITMGFFNLPPLQYRDASDSKVKGYFISHFEEEASKMGYQVKWLGPLPLARLGDYLKSGLEVEGTVGFPKLPEYEPYMYLPRFRCL